MTTNALTERAVIRRINAHLRREKENYSLRALRRGTRDERELGRYIGASGSTGSIYVHGRFRSLSDLAERYRELFHEAELAGLGVAV
jgi:hypothetical protein